MNKIKPNYIEIDWYCPACKGKYSQQYSRYDKYVQCDSCLDTFEVDFSHFALEDVEDEE